MSVFFDTTPLTSAWWEGSFRVTVRAVVKLESPYLAFADMEI